MTQNQFMTTNIDGTHPDDYYIFPVNDRNNLLSADFLRTIDANLYKKYSSKFYKSFLQYDVLKHDDAQKLTNELNRLKL